jgi:4'-phosphopantetheinyl transferase
MMARGNHQCKTAGVMTPERLDSDTVRVRWMPVGAGDAANLTRWRGMLDADELARADRYHFASDRDTFIAAHALARAMLSDATGLPTAIWRYVTGEFGKPALAADCAGGGLRFNISHTRGFVACAIARDEVGVDVEASDRRTDFDIADRFFAPEEAQLVKSVPPEGRACVFFRFWTLKEAFIKATGEGLRRPLDSFSFTFNPVRIVFHPEREGIPRRDNPAAWQFAEYNPAPDRPLALAILRTTLQPLRLDAREARPEEIAPTALDEAGSVTALISRCSGTLRAREPVHER